MVVRAIRSYRPGKTRPGTRGFCREVLTFARGWAILALFLAVIGADPDSNGVTSKVTSVGQVMVGEMLRAGSSMPPLCGAVVDLPT